MTDEIQSSIWPPEKLNVVPEVDGNLSALIERREGVRPRLFDDVEPRLAAEIESKQLALISHANAFTQNSNEYSKEPEITATGSFKPSESPGDNPAPNVDDTEPENIGDAVLVKCYRVTEDHIQGFPFRLL